MSADPKSHTIACCACGSVELEATGAPIHCVVCYCDHCQQAARQIEALPNAHAVTDPDGGSSYVLYRNDRVTCARGADLLTDYKLTEKSATKRVVASCCNSAMYLGFDRGPFWFSMFRARFQGEVPPVQMRVQTRFKRDGVELPSDVPTHAKFPLRFFARLIAAWIAMLLRR
jgi:hypothetical protein